MTEETIDVSNDTQERWKIVIIEDDHLQLKLLRRYLQDHDYDVYDFKTAEQAIDELPVISPDMILLDVNLGSSNGFYICRHIKLDPLTSDIPIIFVTGVSDTQDIVRGFEAGAVDYITKPVQQKVLLARLKTHLEIYHLQKQIKNQYEMLADSENRFRSLFEHAFIGIIIINSQGNITMINSKVEEMLSYQREELIGQPLDILLPERYRDSHRTACQEFISNFESRLMGIGKYFAARRKNGSELTVEIGLNCIRTCDDTLVMCYLMDVTRRKLAEEARDILDEALRKANQNLERNIQERTRELKEAQAKILEQQRLQQEIELAAQMQESLMPRNMPVIEGFEFAATALPAYYVSGDLYDFILPSPQDCYVILADISGKGIPSAMLNSTARTMIRTEIKHERSASVLLKNINSSLYEELSQLEMFITFFVAYLDMENRRIRYANAGHTEFIWWKNVSKSCQLMPSTGIPIGIFDDLTIEEETIPLRPGDVFVFYSDGITEAANKKDEFFGIDRLVDIIYQNARKSAPELADLIINIVEEHQGEASRSDDLTLIVLKIKPFIIEWTTPALLENLDEALKKLRNATLGYSEEFAYQLELAASEILTNIISHSYENKAGDVQLILHLNDDGIQLDLYDQGESFDPSHIPTPNLDEPLEGGYGLFIVQNIIDELKYEANTVSGNHWSMIKHCIPEP